MKVFVDTNIYLDFFRMREADLQQLQELGRLLQNGRLEIYLPDHVQKEFFKNRGAVLSDLLGQISAEPAFHFPLAFKDFPGYDEALAASREAKRSYARVRDAFSRAAKDGSLQASQLLKEIFDRSTPIVCDDEIIARAQLRRRLRRPPLKEADDSIGDAVNWEAIKSAWNRADREPLHIVSKDDDYADRLDSTKAHEYLQQEWQAEFEGSNLVLHRSLKAFLDSVLPGIVISDDPAVEGLLNELAHTRSFAETHMVIEKLRPYVPFSLPAAERLLSVVEANNQVEWIVGDEDIYTVLQAVSREHRDRLGDRSKERLDSWIETGRTQQE